MGRLRRAHPGAAARESVMASPPIIATAASARGSLVLLLFASLRFPGK
ncbi:hypothetical protein ACP4OV_023966 [Aristida adscensionis]